MSGFARALEQNPAPSALGDIALRYEPSMLIGEAPLGVSSWRPTVALVVGVVGVVLAVLLGVMGSGPASLAGCLSLAALGFAGAARWRSLERSRRGFVVNFATTSLRLDFTTPIAGQPRTLVVPFDAVRAVLLLDQADGACCLVVEVDRGGRRLREVLIAGVTQPEREAAARFARVLEGAFGLGVKPQLT